MRINVFIRCMIAHAIKARFSRLVFPCDRLYFKSVGKTYQFECELCQYRIKISGGADAGVDCAVQTIVCRDCRELFDVFTRVRRRATIIEKLKPLHPEIPPRQLRTVPPQPPGWNDIPLACPVSALHRIETWKDPGRCPRCGCYLEKNGLPYRVWD